MTGSNKKIEKLIDVAIVGSGGQVGKVLNSVLARFQELNLIFVSSSSAQKSNAVLWNYNSPFPIEKINDYRKGKVAIVIWSAISWPQSAEDVHQSKTLLEATLEELPEEFRFIYISSMTIKSKSNTLYTRQKISEEKLIKKSNHIIWRMGVMDTAEPFGIKLAMLRLAKTLKCLPVPFPEKPMSLTSEIEIKRAATNSILSMSYSNSKFTELDLVSSEKLSLSEYGSLLIRGHKINAIVLPLPKYISEFLVCILKIVAPNFSLTQRLIALSEY